MFAPSTPAPLPSAPAAQSAQGAPAALARYGFGGADLGMSLEDWRKLSPQKEAAPCAPEAGSTRLVTCLTEDLPLGGAYAARNLQYRFLEGKLVEISFQTSIDGFDYATAALKRRFGNPTVIKRDTIKLTDGAIFPHVLMTWKNGRSTISLSDPVAKGVTLSVRLKLDDAAAQIANAS